MRAAQCPIGSRLGGSSPGNSQVGSNPLVGGRMPEGSAPVGPSPLGVGVPLGVGEEDGDWLDWLGESLGPPDPEAFVLGWSVALPRPALGV